MCYCFDKERGSTERTIHKATLYLLRDTPRVIASYAPHVRQEPDGASDPPEPSEDTAAFGGPYILL